MARRARRAERPQALELVGIGQDQPNGPPLIGHRATRAQQTAPEPTIDRRVRHRQAHRQFQQRQLRGRLPFAADSDAELFRLIIAGNLVWKGPQFDTVRAEAKDLIQKLINVEPDERWTAKQVLEHPWIKVSGCS